MSNYNLKSIKAEFKAKGIFYTTSELAEYMKSLIDIDYNEVYDPTSGDGGLLSVFGDEVKKYGQEINEHQLTAANSRLINFEGYCGDTLKNPYFKDKKFKCIVANPPFSIEWEQPILNGIFTDERFKNIPVLPPKSKADYAFILHCLYYLDDNGIAIILNFPGILYRGQSEGLIRRWIIEQNYIDKVIRIPGKTFVDTTIETAIIVFKKNKKTTDILFIDTEIKKERVVGIDEVISSDYVLSVRRYVQTENEITICDPIKLQADARNGMIKKIQKDIEIDKMVCEMEGFDFNEYIKALKSLLAEY